MRGILDAHELLRTRQCEQRLAEPDRFPLRSAPLRPPIGRSSRALTKSVERRTCSACSRAFRSCCASSCDVSVCVRATSSPLSSCNCCANQTTADEPEAKRRVRWGFECTGAGLARLGRLHQLLQLKQRGPKLLHCLHTYRTEAARSGGRHADTRSEAQLLVVAWLSRCA